MKEELDVERGVLTLIERIRCIRETRAILIKEEMSLATPMIQDLSMVGNIYDKFMFYQRGRRKRQVRKQLIFIILFLFSPGSLGGTKMRRGLREQIARVLGCTCSNVSHDYKDVTFFYLVYPKFRNEVNTMLRKLVKELDIDGK